MTSSPNSNSPNPAAPFVCKRCGTCCRLPGGFVHLAPHEIPSIAHALSLSEEEFINTWTDLAPNRKGLVLKNLPDHSCCFLTPTGCRIHHVKPSQCRDFPLSWHNPDSALTCPGLASPP